MHEVRELAKTCHACGKPTVQPTKWGDQADNALILSFEGGYAYFIDPEPLTGGEYVAVICHDCAHSLCDQVPWIAKLLKPYNSHSHTKEFEDANPDHYGWDYTWKDNPDFTDTELNAAIAEESERRYG